MISARKTSSTAGRPRSTRIEVLIRRLRYFRWRRKEIRMLKLLRAASPPVWSRLSKREVKTS
ncbi:hypothetical protein KCP74_15195 [Salmonella enterica subsp. enterica]|nr:hypothetical protein KCP74_15195 [Salmonella enterica subsp. enterica]